MSSSSSSSSPLGSDTAAAAADATAAKPVRVVQADKPSIITGKKRGCTEGEIDDGATYNTTTTAHSAEILPPPSSSSSSTNTGGVVFDGASSSSSSKRPRNDTEVPEEWSKAEDDVLLETVPKCKHITHPVTRYETVAIAVSTTTKMRYWSDCWNRYEHLQSEKNEEQSEKIEEQSEKIEEQSEIIEEYERVRKMISLEMVLSLPKGHMKLTRTGSDYSDVYGKRHLPAEATENDFPLVDITKEQVMQKLEKVKSAMPSQLILSFWDKKTTNQIALDERQLPGFVNFHYNTEADIADLVKRAVTDAINILQEWDPKTYEKLSVRMEMQLFSCKPDILVVRCNNNPIFAVEVKKPLPDSNSKGLAYYEPVLGQAFDYLKLLEALGFRNSLVVTTNFDQSFASWTNGLTNEKEKEESPASSPDDSKGQVSLSATTHDQSSATNTNQPANTNMKSPPVFKVRSTAENKTTCSESPPMLKPPPSPMLRNISSDSAKPVDFKPDKDRTMARSEVETSDELVWLLCRSISWAVKHEAQPARTILDLEPLKSYLFPKVLRVTSGEYEWGSLQVTINSDTGKAKADTRSSVVGETYYIIGILGYGDTSSVYHALDRDGKQVAIKVYVKATDENEKWLKSEVFKKTAGDAMNREAERLLSFYSFLEGQVHVTVLFNGLSCLVMPLFKPVVKNHRDGALTGIEQTLRNFFFDKKNMWKYCGDDVRWRHVGLYHHGQKDHYILYDLADLEELEESEDRGELVRTYLSTLKSRIKSEETTDAEMFKSSEVEELT